MVEILNVYMFHLMLNYYKKVRGVGCYIITAILSAGMKG